MKKFTKPALYLILIMCIIALFYFLAGSGNSVEIFKQYDSLKSSSSSNFEKAREFLISYTIATGDDSLALEFGLTKEDVYQTGGSGGDGGDSGSGGSGPPDPPPPPTGDKGIDASKAVASLFVKTGKPNYPIGSPSRSDYFLNYSQSSGMPKDLDYEGKKVRTSHRDCSCYCSAMRYLLGMDSTYVHRNSGAFSSQLNDVTASISKMGDLRMGDILYRSGHVAMVVKVDGSTIYVGDFGSASTSDYSSGTVGKNGDNTANNGFAYTFNAGDRFQGNNKSFVKVLR